jgi:hypothetical protein
MFNKQPLERQDVDGRPNEQRYTKESRERVNI